MTKTYAILQKKLHELEVQLSHDNIIHPNSLSQELHQKLLFVANLLSAEIASCPTKPRHLKHIARRLVQLENAFRTNFDLLEDDHVVDDSTSTCSCTESCLNDDDDGDVGSHAPSSCLEDEMEGCGECFYECEKEESHEEMMKKEEIKIRFLGVGKFCGAMTSGFLIGMVLMGVFVIFIEFFGYFQVQQNGVFVTPT